MEPRTTKGPSTRIGPARKVSQGSFPGQSDRAASAASSVVFPCFKAVLGASVRAWAPTSCTRQTQARVARPRRGQVTWAPKSKNGREHESGQGAPSFVGVDPAQAQWRAPERDTTGVREGWWAARREKARKKPEAPRARLYGHPPPTTHPCGPGLGRYPAPTASGKPSSLQIDSNNNNNNVFSLASQTTFPGALETVAASAHVRGIPHSFARGPTVRV
jgi:hypothetical protein